MTVNNNIILRSAITFLVFVSSFLSCTQRDNNGSGSQERTGVSKEDLMRANQFLVGKDMELIKAYTQRRGWDIEFTSTGLGYQIYEHGEGRKVEKGKLVTLNYTLSLMDGRVCYSSDSDGPKTFRVGQGGVEAGLEEGILLLKMNDRARFIIPPFLGHGLIGDQNRIPPRAVLIYEVEVTGVS